MEQLWFLVPLLVCPLVMGGMMMWMMRGMRSGRAERERSDEAIATTERRSRT